MYKLNDPPLQFVKVLSIWLYSMNQEQGQENCRRVRSGNRIHTETSAALSAPVTNIPSCCYRRSANRKIQENRFGEPHMQTAAANEEHTAARGYSVPRQARPRR